MLARDIFQEDPRDLGYRQYRVLLHIFSITVDILYHTVFAHFIGLTGGETFCTRRERLTKTSVSMKRFRSRRKKRMGKCVVHQKLKSSFGWAELSAF